jgi:hypothetical protein
MAKRKKPADPAPPGPNHLVVEARKCFQDGEGAESENRTNMADDLKFVYEPGYQWDATAKSKRQGRPCYTFNRVIGAVNQAIGEQRQVRPSGKVRAVSKDAAAPTAEVFGGLMRNIEAISRAENVYDNQFKYAVAGGYGAWRVLPYYCDDNSFDQELLIQEVANPFTVMWDNNATDPCKRDARWATVAERISKEQYREEYPDFDPQSFEASRDNRGWFTNSDVRIAEYYKKISRQKTIARLTDGRVVDYDATTKRILDELANAEFGGDRQAPQIEVDSDGNERTRKVDIYSVVWCKVDGANVLEGPFEYKWKYIPVIRLPGRYVNIEGKQLLQSLHRHAKDAQRTYNYHRSTMVETAALTPRAPYLVTSKMIKGREDQWRTLNAVNRPYLEYDPDPLAVASGGMPKREPPPDVPQALITLAAQDAEDIRQGTGQVGPHDQQQDQNNPESGVSRQFRMQSSESGTYEFLDNLGKAIQFTWDVCINMIPTIYDTDRVVRTIGVDGIESYVRVNGIDPNDPKAFMHKLKEGQYDCTVTLGPAFATQRLEALSTLLEASEKVPLIGQVAPDLIAKMLDTRDGDELHKRVRQELIRMGKIVPTERDLEDMGPPPAEDPVQKALANRLIAQANRDQAEADKTQAETVAEAIKAHGAPIELQKLIDELVGKRLENMIAAQQLGIGAGGMLLMQRTAQRQSGVNGGAA